MESIINQLTEIESAASAIAEHAELQKSVLDKEYEEKRKQFDLDLEQETQAHPVSYTHLPSSARILS